MKNSTGSACHAYGPTVLIAKRTTINQEANTYFYHTDHLGSVRSVTDSSKNIIAASTYHLFGEIEVEEGSEKYLYNGKEKDTTGLYYYGARYYDPQIGRFITRDLRIGKKKNSQSLNRYSYCTNNPLKYVDPAGLSFEQADEAVENILKEDEEVEVLNDENVEGGYFNNPNGEGFIFLESDVYKCGNIGVAVGTVHVPGSTNTDPAHGLVIFHFDDDGDITDVKFIDFRDFDERNPEKFGEIHSFLNELRDEGLFKEFENALWELNNWCMKQDHSGLGGSTSVAGIVTAVGGSGAIAVTGGGAGIVGLYVAARSSHWKNTAVMIQKMLRIISESKD